MEEIPDVYKRQDSITSSIALAMGWSPLKVSIPVVVLAAFFLLRITENSRIKSDAAIAMISASSLAIGIIVTSLTTGMTTDVSSYMFGSILAMTKEDVMLSAVPVSYTHLSVKKPEQNHFFFIPAIM